MKTLEECVKIYQETGVYILDAYMHENKYILENIQDIFDEYVEEAENHSTPFYLHVLQRISDWQIDVGFGKEIEVTEDMSFEDVIEVILDDETEEYH